ncbi:hypothetical protein P4O66_017183, partial [Electrophorus voltai]
ERLCAFCYCGARSLLGQGELRLFKATPGCEAPPCRQGRTEEDGSTAAVQLGRPRGPERFRAVLWGGTRGTSLSVRLGPQRAFPPGLS